MEKNQEIEDIKLLINQYGNVPFDFRYNSSNLDKKQFQSLKNHASKNQETCTMYKSMIERRIELLKKEFETFSSSKTLQPIHKLRIMVQQIDLYADLEPKKCLSLKDNSKKLQLTYLDTCAIILRSPVFVIDAPEHVKEITKDEELFFSQIPEPSDIEDHIYSNERDHLYSTKTWYDKLPEKIKKYRLTIKDKKWLDALYYPSVIYRLNPECNEIQNKIRSINPRNNFDNLYLSRLIQ